MGTKLAGSYGYLNQGSDRARLIVDKFVPDDYIWIMPANYDFDGNYYTETVKVIVSPANEKMGQDLVDQHNEIVDSPLSKAMREDEDEEV